MRQNELRHGRPLVCLGEEQLGGSAIPLWARSLRSLIFTLLAMSKRSATELQNTAADEGQSFIKTSGSGSRREHVLTSEMGEFEDAWEDEMESDEEVADAENQDGAFL